MVALPLLLSSSCWYGGYLDGGRGFLDKSTELRLLSRKVTCWDWSNIEQASSIQPRCTPQESRCGDISITVGHADFSAYGFPFGYPPELYSPMQARRRSCLGLLDQPRFQCNFRIRRLHCSFRAASRTKVRQQLVVAGGGTEGTLV